MKKALFILSLLFYSSVFAQDLTGVRILIYPFSSSAEDNIDNYTKAKFYEKLLNNFGAEVTVIDNRKNNLPMSQIGELINQCKPDFIHFIFSKDLVKTDNENYSLVIYNSFDNFDIEEAGKLILDGIANSNRVDNKYLSAVEENGLSGNFFTGLNSPGIISVDSKNNFPSKSRVSKNKDYLKNEVWGYLRGIINFYETTPFNKGFIAGFVKDKFEKINAEAGESEDNLKPINNFKVTLFPGAKEYIGDFNNNGFYYFDSLNVGEYKLLFEAGTYSADSIIATVASNQTTFSDIFLEKDYSIPPSVFNYSPHDTTQLADTESPIKIVFSIPMDQESTEEAFKVIPDIDGEFEWSNEDHVLNFYPENALDTSSLYEVLIDTTAKGKNNFNIESVSKFYFYTKHNNVDITWSNVDLKGDSVITTQPIEINFSKPMDITEVEDAFEIEPEAEGHFEWSADFTKMRFVPDRALLTSTKYEVIIDENAETYNGLELGFDYILEFFTKSTHIHPKIVSAVPNTGIADVFINSEIEIEFNEAMQTEYDGDVLIIEPTVEGKLIWNDKRTKMKFVPGQLLTPSTKYKVSITNIINNKYGIPLENNYEFSFATNNRGRLQLVKNYPAINQKGISTSSKIKLVFNYPVDINVLKNNISLTNSSGKEISLIDYSISENGNSFEVYCRPADYLQNDAEYILLLRKDIKDDLNISLLDNISIRFKTENKISEAGDLIDEFEDMSGWIKLDSANSSYGIDKKMTSFSINDVERISGKYSGKISYRFNNEKGMLNITRSKPINISGLSGKMGVWVFGDLSNNLLAAEFINEDSENIEILLDTLNWSGWKFREFNLNGIANVTLSFTGLSVKHSTRGDISGDLFLDDLQVSKLNNLTQVEEPVPNEFSLEQNYPNPFNPATTISFRIPTPTTVTLEVLNILGQKVRSLIHKENYSAGTWSIEWDGKSDYGEFMPSGVYLYKLKAGEFTEVKKMILIK